MKTVVTKCLRCGGGVLPFSMFESLAEDWGFKRWALHPKKGVVCRACGILYSDFGSSWNRVFIYRLLHPNVCRKCGESVEWKSGQEMGMRVKCSMCGCAYWVDEPYQDVVCTYGWVRGVLKGKYVWEDNGRVYREVK